MSVNFPNFVTFLDEGQSKEECAVKAEFLNLIKSDIVSLTEMSGINSRLCYEKEKGGRSRRFDMSYHAGAA